MAGGGGRSLVSLRVLEKHTWDRAGGVRAPLSSQWALSSGWMDGWMDGRRMSE